MSAVLNSPQLSRRDFLKSSGLALGGLTIGVSFPLGLLSADEHPGFAPNAWLHIAENGDTTLWCGRCEMGQGISTALPAAVADELEADWSRVRVLQADGHKDKFGPQGTGGSRSINVMLEPMRKAGAAGREMLVAAAAQSWGIPASECYAANHQVLNQRDDRVLGYGELATLAANQPVPEDPLLKTREQFRYIGKPVQRHDQDEVVVGKLIYGADVKLPGMKYAAVRHVPVMGGSLKSVDKSPLDGMQGITVVEIERFDNPYGTVGGVGVIADNTWLAQEAAKKLQIEWEAGPHGSYETTAYKAQLVQHVEAPAEKIFERGNVDQALADGQVRLSGTYVGAHLSHSPMEPMASAAWVTDDRCEIWASTQDPQGIQRTIAAYLGRDEADIIVHVMMAGGAFGRKFQCDYVTEAVALSKAINAPVQLTWSREEDTRTGYYHSCSAQYIEAALDAQGNVSAWLHRAAFPPISSLFDPTVTRAGEQELVRIIKHPYGIENVRIESGEAIAHTRIGWYRAVYDIFWGFAINVFSNELAEKAGKDPLEFYRTIYANSKDPEQVETAQRSLAVLNKAAEMGGWGKSLPKGEGLGIAVHHSYESYTAMVVHAALDGDAIRVLRVDCAVDCGLVLNPDIATAQMEGAVIMGMGLALRTEVRFKDGAVVNSNYHDYPVLRIHEAPAVIKVEFIGQEQRSTGLGEPGVPTFAPALANAIYAAGGPRYRALPFNSGV